MLALEVCVATLGPDCEGTVEVVVVMVGWSSQVTSLSLNEKLQKKLGDLKSGQSFKVVILPLKKIFFIF